MTQKGDSTSVLNDYVERLDTDREFARFEFQRLAERTTRLRHRLIEGPLRLSEIPREELAETVDISFANAIQEAEEINDFRTEDVWVFSAEITSLDEAISMVQTQSPQWTAWGKTAGAPGDTEHLYCHVVVVGRKIVRAKRRRSHRFIDRLGRDKRWKWIKTAAFDDAKVTNSRGPGVFVIDNAVETFFDMYGAEAQRFDLKKQAPLVQPPFVPMWLEFELPGQDERGPGTFGLYATVSKMDDPDFDRTMKAWTADEDSDVNATVREIAHQGTYLVATSGIFETDLGDIAALGSWMYTTDDEGALVEQPRWIPAREDARMLKEAVTQKCLYPCLFAISLTHCRNVSTKAHEPARKLSKAHRKRHGSPLVTYRTIVIEPLAARGGSSATKGVVESPGPRALHICRGHFKTYTADAPLLGRAVGTYWWPQHVRGSAEAGEVVKDYEVRA